MARADPPLRPRLWLALAALLIGGGVLIAALTERAGGIEVRDLRFRGADGTVFSALLFRPPTATAGHPAPGVLAVHGYVNTRETQSPFAIELARRGYVVLELDQRGHGYSGGAAISKGFGGPEGLAYLRALPFVDKDEIGLEGHSMGGWAVLAAAAAMPGGYRAVVLEGSCTGAPFAAEGTPSWPRNLEVVFSRFDEFAPLMWGVPRAAEVAASPKLERLFGQAGPVAGGRLYGDPAAGTARRLLQPATTHPGDHLSNAAVADALDWFGLTLKGGKGRPATDQIWPLKETATGLALVGAFCLLLGLFDLLLSFAPFSALRAAPPPGAAPSGWRFWTLALLAAFVPAVSWMALNLTAPWLKPSPLFPQGIANGLVVWALGNAAFALIAGRLLAPRAELARASWPLALGLAVLVVGGVYLAAALAGLAAVDFRFWVVALKPMSARQALAAAAYLAPFAVFIFVAFRGLAVLRAGPATAAAILCGGFLVVEAAQYALLLTTGALPFPGQALNTILAIQFVPFFAALGGLGAYAWRRTGSLLPGALAASLLATWYLVAGTATHVA